MGKQETYVTQPYVDMVTGEWVVSIATPVYNGAKVNGMLVVDLNMAQISEFLRQLSFGDVWSCSFAVVRQYHYRSG